MAMGDEAVIATNDDATACKRSAVHFGYIGKCSSITFHSVFG